MQCVFQFGHSESFAGADRVDRVADTNIIIQFGECLSLVFGQVDFVVDDFGGNLAKFTYRQILVDQQPIRSGEGEMTTNTRSKLAATTFSLPE